MISKLFYEAILRPLTIILMNIIWVKKAINSDNIPKTGSAILVANHSSYLDFLIVPSLLKRRVRIIAAKELTTLPLIGWYARNDDCILVDRTKPGTKYFKNAVKALENGQVLLVFPEGTRSIDGKLGSWKRAFVRLSLMTGAPIIPVAIKGTFEDLPKNGKLKFKKNCIVMFGKPFKIDRLPGGKATKEGIDSIIIDIRSKIIAMLDSL